MTRDEAREHARAQLGKYLASKGIDTRKNFACILHKHEDKKHNMAYHRDRRSVKCFHCGFYGDIFDVIGAEYGLTGAAMFAKTYEVLGISVDEQTPRKTPRLQVENAAPQQQPVIKIPQPKTNGSPQTFTLYYSNVRGNLQNVLYPYAQEITDKEALSKAVTFDHVSVTYKDNHRKNDNFISSNAIMMDVDNDSDKGDVPPSEWVDENHLRRAFPGVPLYVVYSRNHMKEKDGKAARPKFHVYFPCEEITKAEDYINLKQALINYYPWFDDAAKDAGRVFSGVENPQIKYSRGDKNLLAFMREDAERLKYLRGAAGHEETMKQLDIAIADSAGRQAIPTGFCDLDTALDDGLYPGLYIIGAISSLGKTTFTLQIADYIAAHGTDVLFFSLEMSRFELMSKSISRITLLNSFDSTNNAKTTRGILAGARYSFYSQTERDLINKSKLEYAENAQSLYIHEGVGNIGINEISAIIEKHIVITGNTPVVFIDYLQIIAPHEPRATDKQNTDHAVFELKRLSRDKKIPVVAISSFNRENYLQPVNFSSFKESGAIEFSSDVLLGLQLSGTDDLKQGEGTKAENIKKVKTWKEANPRKVQVKVLKNRNGKTDISPEYNFYPMFNYFEEITDNPFIQ